VSGFEFLEEAEEELFQAVEYYETQELGLGLKFLSEIRYTSNSIASNPLIYRERLGGYRRVNLAVFPYYLPYFMREDRIIFAAVAHASRHPLYWLDRP
jgi:plasmid stabilization system protein ParE